MPSIQVRRGCDGHVRIAQNMDWTVARVGSEDDTPSPMDWDIDGLDDIDLDIRP